MSMESSYGVGVQNRFCLPDEDSVEVDDPQDILQDIEKKTEVKKEAPTKKPLAKGQQGKGKPAEKTQKGGKPASAGGDRSKPRGGGRVEESRFGQSDRSFGSRSFGAPSDGFGSDSRPERGGERGRGRGRGRGGRGGRGGGGRREFDRRSGNDRSSVKPTEKREGGGSHNWGNPIEDFNSEGRENTTSTWTSDEPQPEEGSKENVPAEGAPAEAVEGETESTEEENKTMTLDEYKAQLEKERFKSDVRVRKAGENEDMSRWKNTRVLKKNPAEEDDEEYTYERREQRAKKVVDLNVKFSEPARRGGPSGRGEGRGRGGRGGGRGRGGRGGGFGASDAGYAPRDASRGSGRGRSTGNTPNFSSEVDFPALG